MSRQIKCTVDTFIIVVFFFLLTLVQLENLNILIGELKSCTKQLKLEQHGTIYRIWCNRVEKGNFGDIKAHKRGNTIDVKGLKVYVKRRKKT